MENHEINKTEDYSVFIIDKPWQKRFHEEFVLRLIKSILKANLLHVRPILVTEDMIVIDGIQRLEAARRLKIPIYFRVYTKEETESLKNELIKVSKPCKWPKEIVKKWKSKCRKRPEEEKHDATKSDM